MNKVTNHKKPIKKRSFAKGVQPFSTGTDSVNENQQLTTDNQKTLIEAEAIKVNETQKLELETQELKPNTATEIDEVGQADLEVTSACLQQNEEPEPPNLSLNSTTKLPVLVEDEQEVESGLALEPEAEVELAFEPESTFELDSKVTSLDELPSHDEGSVSAIDDTTAPEQEEHSSVEQDDSLLANAVATVYNATIHRQVNAALTVVKHTNGNRIKFGKDVRAELQLTDTGFVEIYIKDKSVLVCKSLTTQGHRLNKGGIVYNKELVEVITDACGLNFEGRSSNSLIQVKYVQSQGQKVAVIS